MTTSIPETSGIYIIRCLPTNKIYVGSAKNLKQRWGRHQSDLRREIHKNSYLQRAWNKYGASSFAFEIVELVMPWSRIDRENYWLKTLKPFNHEIGFNVLPIAGEPASRKGVIVSVETRAKLSASAKKRDVCYKAIEAMKQSNTGKKRSPETIEKIAAIHRGMKRSSETCANIGVSLAKKWIIIDPDGIEMPIENLRKFCREHDLHHGHMIAVAQGKYSQHKGWRCRYG